MKTKLLIYVSVILFCSCNKNNKIIAQPMTEKLYVTINNETHTVSMENNISTQALVTALQTADIIYEAHDYNNFEKVGNIGQTFPTDDQQITTSAGDLMLYNGDNICIFYGSNSWLYTRIGKFDNMSAEEVRQFVKAGKNNVTVRLSLHPQNTSIHDHSSDQHKNGPTYIITGQLAPKNHKGIVIQNGKKIMK